MNSDNTAPTEQLRSLLAARARAAAAELGERKITPKQLEGLANAIAGAECSDTDHDCLGIALITYFESSPHRPENDPPCDDEGLEGYTQWVMSKTHEMLINAARISLALFGGGEVQR